MLSESTDAAEAATGAAGVVFFGRSVAIAAVAIANDATVASRVFFMCFPS